MNTLVKGMKQNGFDMISMDVLPLPTVQIAVFYSVNITLQYFIDSFTTNVSTNSYNGYNFRDMRNKYFGTRNVP